MSKSKQNEQLVPDTTLISNSTKLNKIGSAILEILKIPSFRNETDVREDFIAPLLKGLGYSNSGKNKIEREVYLDVSDLIVGRKKKSIEKIIPDYILSINGSRKWVIDAKGPEESVYDEKSISQAYSYSIHREINAKFFVLANGEELAIYNTADQGYKPVVSFKRYELDYRWQELYELLSAKAFATRLKLLKDEDEELSPDKVRLPDSNNRGVTEPISRIITPRKQSSPVHHGTHPYFTKRAWNVVSEYITHFTRKGDTVLDIYGGSGVTAIEALFLKRKSIHFDINPIANFMTEALALPVSLDSLNKEYEKIMSKFSPKVEEIYKVKNPKISHWYPKDVLLPSDADVKYLHEYFTKHQLASLSFLNSEINKIRDPDLKKVFRLIFSSTLVKCNISFHNTPRKGKTPGGGDAGFLKYYRYQIPKKRYEEQNPCSVFESKYKAMLKAKREVQKFITKSDYKKLLKVKTESSTNLKYIKDESVDYIFTDPPYGSKISYLDCSILWNSWLKLNVTPEMKKLEVISGGELNKSDEEYINLLQASLREAHRVLKPSSWLSIVFASENPKFWHAIRDFCISIGFEHVNTVCQPSKRKSVKKNQNPLTVFSGEMILNFKKTNKSRNIVGISTTLPPKQYIFNNVELTIVNNEGRATIEEIMQDLVPKLWESGLLGAVSNEIDDLTKLLKESFDQNKDGTWSIKAKTKIGHHISLEKRLKFYLLSSLNKAKNENRLLTIDEIIMEVMPFLRNGVTPTNQYIINEVKKLAHSPDGIHWQVQISGELNL